MIFTERVRYFKKSEKDEKLEDGTMVKVCRHKGKDPILLHDNIKRRRFDPGAKHQFKKNPHVLVLVVVFQPRGRKCSSSPVCWRMNEIKF